MGIKNKKQWETAFLEACQTGNIENVRHLCQKQYLEGGWADIHLYGDYGFLVACENGHLEVVKYLLTSQELKETGHAFADLHAEDEAGFRGACLSGNLGLVKYLLTSSELTEAGHTFADVHAEKEEGFGWACKNEYWNVIRWLVIDYGIEKSSTIEEIIKEYPQAQEYFRVREELKEIQSILKSKPGLQGKTSNTTLKL